MPLILDPRPAASDLRGRLQSLRGRLRRSTLVTAFVGLTAGIVGAISIACWLDRTFHLPSLPRAYLLAAIVLFIVALARRLLIQPLRAIGDDVEIALRIERHHPILGDALASAAQFAHEPTGHRPGDSPQLRRATARLAVNRSIDLDFGDLVDNHVLVRCFLALLLALALAAPLVLRPTAGLLLSRLADPFGEHPWPLETVLSVKAPSEIARGEPFELQVTVERKIPDRVVLSLSLGGAPEIDHSYPLTAQSSDGREQFTIKLEPSRVPRTFQYQLRANNAATGLQTVTVKVPPELAALDGRPSPQIRLAYPAYTDLPTMQLPDGGGMVEGVLGTTLQIRGAANRPIASAAIAFRATDANTIAGLSGLAFASAGPDLALALLPAACSIAVPNRLPMDAHGTRFAGSFIPPISAAYEIRLTDANGLVGRRPLDIRVLADPSPSVNLERPSVGSDSLELATAAQFALKAIVEDPTFAIRRVAIEYRTRLGEPPRRITLYDGDSLGQILPHFIGVVQPVRLRPVRLDIDRRVSMTMFRHGDSKPLGIGDVLTFSVIAEDFDDVSPWKAPGHSHEVDLRIVGSERLDALTQKDRADLAAGLRNLLARQIEAGQNTSGPERELRSTGKLRPEDAISLDKAQSQQRQILERLGDDRDGLRGLAARLARSIADNPDGNAAARDRADRLVDGLESLGKDVLEPIEPLLSAARKDAGPVAPTDRPHSPLAEATRRQTEAENNLRDLAELAEAGGNTGSLAAEAAQLASQQRQLAAEREELSRSVPAGTSPDNLAPNDRAALEQLQNRQESLAQKANKLSQQIDAEAEKTAAEAKTSSANNASSAAAREKADALQRRVQGLAAAREAAQGIESKNPSEPLTEQMNKAAEAIATNRLGEAQRRQDTAARQLDRIRDALREPEGPDLDRLKKDRIQADEQMDRLTKEQESLQTQARATEQIADPVERKKQLERLAREQRQLADKVRDAARELSRQRQTEASKDLERAARNMDKSADVLEQGRDASKLQDDALDRLDDAKDRTEQARAETEEKLQHEKALKLTARLTGLADRQAALSAEGERLFQAGQSSGGWSRSLIKSLTDLARDEEGLAKEIEQLTANHLRSFKVLQKMAEHAVTALSEASAAIDDARANGLTPATMEADRAAVRRPQELALKRLKQLQALIKPPDEKAESAAKPSGGLTGQSPDSPARPLDGDRIKVTAQLQALRDLQAELNERTAAFARLHPDPNTWTNADRAEVDAIRRAQMEMVELLREVTPDTPPPTGEKR